MSTWDSHETVATPADIHGDITENMSFPGQFSESGSDRGDLSDPFSISRRSYALSSLEEDAIIEELKTI